MFSSSKMAKRLTLGAGVAAMLAAAVPAGAQDRGTLGYLNQRTGQFASIQQTNGPISEAATVSVNGIVKMTFKITILSSVATDAVISCAGMLSSNDYAGGYAYMESKAMKASRSGSTATCTVNVPYQWVLLNKTEGITPSYTITIKDTKSTSLHERTAYAHTLPSFAFPSNGATVTKSYNVAL